ncbi:MAG TPA: response regulator transcription factor [Dehalococcoidales bacterium]|nr:response regulator transcription factor [Dehalococcoidales bacterium]
MRKCPLILVADDEEPLLRLLKKSLGLEGYDVVTASNGVKALQAFEGSDPDLAILDIGMPGLDGFSVLKVIREQSSIPVIMLTAMDEPACVERALAGGADDFMIKPFDRVELMARVHAKLRRNGSDDIGQSRAGKTKALGR